MVGQFVLQCGYCLNCFILVQCAASADRARAATQERRHAGMCLFDFRRETQLDDSSLHFMLSSRNPYSARRSLDNVFR